MNADSGLSGLSGLVPGGGITTLLKDSFTGTAGTNLTAHTMDVGPGWTIGAGTWKLNASNQATDNPHAGLDAIWADSGQSDVTVSADVTIPNNGDDAGIAVRVTDINNFWYVRGVPSGAPVFQLMEVTSGSSTQRASSTPAIGNGANTYSIVTSGTNLTGSINGSQQWTFSSSVRQGATRCGLGCNTSTDAFDNFLVTQP